MDNIVFKKKADANAFKNNLEVDRFGDTNIVKVNIALDKSTVDAVELIHGQWIILDPDRHGNGKPCCSVCHTYKLMAWSDHSRCNYCPNCGAKMYGGNEDENS